MSEASLTTGGWQLSSSSDPKALEVVDGLGRFSEFGAHYSRRTPGSRTFTGVGQEVVLVHPSGAVWAVVRSRVPSPRGSGASRGRDGSPVLGRYVWRNMMFRNLGGSLASELIRTAVASTALVWLVRYGDLPVEPRQTEVRGDAVASEVVGYCYRRAGWKKVRVARGLTYFECPRRQIESAVSQLGERVLA